MADDFAMHLHEMKAAVATGEIQISDLGRISTALHDLRVRIARVVVDGARSGRPDDRTLELAALRMTSLEEGSTQLVYKGGRSVSEAPIPTALWQWPELSSNIAAEQAQQNEFDAKFAELIVGVETQTPPAWVTPPVAAGVVALLGVLDTACAEVDFDGGPFLHVRFATDVSREPWRVRVFAQENLTVSGVLMKVDLASRAFRIADDVGTKIYLDDVADHDEAAGLVGRRVIATGLLVSRSNPRGRAATVHLADATVHESPPVGAPVAAAVQLSGTRPFDPAELADPGEDLDLDVDLEEIERMLALIHE